jgi:predicted nucleotidyltransferase
MKDIEIIKQAIIFQLQNIFSDKLSEVILYGSYARGDFKEDSDIDFAAIVKIDRKDIGQYNSNLGHLMSEISLQYDLLPSIDCIPKDEFLYWKQYLPYYKNIDMEGIRIYN